MAAQLLTIDDVLTLLARECAKEGSAARWAARHGMSRAYLSAVMRRETPPSARILSAIGLAEAGVMYQRRK